MDVESYRRQKEKLQQRLEEPELHRRTLPDLEPGTPVRMQPIQRSEKEWKPATVVERCGNRSYKVKNSEGRQFRRDRQQLRTASTKDPSPLNIEATESILSSTSYSNLPSRNKNNLPSFNNVNLPCTNSDYQPECSLPIVTVINLIYLNAYLMFKIVLYLLVTLNLVHLNHYLVLLIVLL